MLSHRLSNLFAFSHSESKTVSIVRAPNLGPWDQPNAVDILNARKSIAVARVFRRGDLSHDPSKTLASEEASYSNDAPHRKNRDI
jgi:hypothetical protein